MNVYLKGCCCLSAELSVKQLPYAPRIPDFARFVVNSLKTKYKEILKLQCRNRQLTDFQADLLACNCKIP